MSADGDAELELLEITRKLSSENRKKLLSYAKAILAARSEAQNRDAE